MSSVTLNIQTYFDEKLLRYFHVDEINMRYFISDDLDPTLTEFHEIVWLVLENEYDN